MSNKDKRTLRAMPPAMVKAKRLKGDIPKRMARYHMITLIKCVPGGFDVWDSNGYKGQLTNEEVKVGFKYLDMGYLVAHPDYECVLLKWK